MENVIAMNQTCMILILAFSPIYTNNTAKISKYPFSYIGFLYKMASACKTIEHNVITMSLPDMLLLTKGSAK